jgi:hypothetical protein
LPCDLQSPHLIGRSAYPPLDFAHDFWIPLANDTKVAVIVCQFLSYTLGDIIYSFVALQPFLSHEKNMPWLTHWSWWGTRVGNEGSVEGSCSTQPTNSWVKYSLLVYVTEMLRLIMPQN